MSALNYLNEGRAFCGEFCSFCD